jgi:hypothetical protein
VITSLHFCYRRLVAAGVDDAVHCDVIVAAALCRYRSMRLEVSSKVATETADNLRAKLRSMENEKRDLQEKLEQASERLEAKDSELAALVRPPCVPVRDVCCRKVKRAQRVTCESLLRYT